MGGTGEGRELRLERERVRLEQRKLQTREMSAPHDPSISTIALVT